MSKDEETRQLIKDLNTLIRARLSGYVEETGQRVLVEYRLELKDANYGYSNKIHTSKASTVNHE